MGVPINASTSVGVEKGCCVTLVGKLVAVAGSASGKNSSGTLDSAGKIRTELSTSSTVGGGVAWGDHETTKASVIAR